VRAMRRIVKATISPGIGVARVGNSASQYFIGPELPYSSAAPPGGYRDRKGALKRQAARFRIYGYDARGSVVAELTSDNADITWTVHVANKKSAWYKFELAMDIPEAVPVPKRNANFSGDSRNQLVIDPGPRSISGRSRQGAKYAFDTGEFLGQEVYLGELRTDPHGRLILLGGRGHSSTPFPNNSAYTFGNNDGWHDDVSDGPVTATVTINGRNIPVDPAWAVVAPPNYAPEIVSVQTMYDVMYDAYKGLFKLGGDKVSFTQHIFPLLSQFCQAQWVNYGFFVQFGHRGPNDFHRPDYFCKLASAAPEFTEVRRQVFNLFRNPDYKLIDIDGWPQVYGDDMTAPLTDARGLMAITRTQYDHLRKWSKGDFEADWEEKAPPPPERIEEVPLAEQPATLDKAAMYFCMGGPFHPGCELTWIMRNPNLYCAPFRIRPRAENQPEPDWGDMLTPAEAISENGPLFASGPGDLTRWMAVPWQTDTASCRAGYEPEYSPYLPTFWPSRAPNQVLAQAEYKKVINRKLPRRARSQAFNQRASWPRFLVGGYIQQINQMVTDFWKLGVVERKPGPKNDSDFPSTMFVEGRPRFRRKVDSNDNLVIGPTEKVTRQRKQKKMG
jgi:hypothetical protein